MNPALLIFLIKGAIRVGRSADNAFAQYQRDAEAVFPNIPVVELEPPAFTQDFFRSEEYQAFVVPDGSEHETRLRKAFPDIFKDDTPPFAGHWNDEYREPLTDEDSDFLYAMALDISERDKAGTGSRENSYSGEAAQILFYQWEKGKGPVSPVVKVAMAIVDVALEYVGTDPSRIGLEGNGAKFLGAFALQLSNLIPDDDDFGAKEKFLGRIGGLFVQSALRTINDNPNLVFNEKHLQELIKNTLEPVIDTLPDPETHFSDYINYKKAAEALMGPAAKAALLTVSKHQKAFLGDKFAPETAMGAVTKAMLDQGAAIGVQEVFSKEGLIALYTAALGVGAARPELFIDNPDADDDAQWAAAQTAAQQFFARMAGVLSDNPPPFDGDLGAELAAVALDTLQDNLAGLIDIDDNWDEVAEKAVSQVIAGMQQGLADDDGNIVASGLSNVQIGEIAKVFAAQAAKNPRMMAGDNEALQTLVGDVAGAIKADTSGLMTFEDWLEVSTDAALNSVADNPQLFLGDDFRAGRLPGEILTPFLEAVADEELQKLTAKGSLLALYDATLKVAAEKPELFIGGAGGGTTGAAATFLFSGVAKTLKANPPPFNGDIGVKLAITALETVQQHGPQLIDFGGKWEPVIEKLVGQVTKGLAEGLGTVGEDGAIDTSKISIDITALAQTFLTEIANAPKLVAGNNEELKTLVKAVASSMAAADNLLLTDGDWKQIIKIATAEAARNPGRLFGLDNNTGVTEDDKKLATDVLSLFFTTISEMAGSPNADKSVLIGETLREAVILLVRNVSGSPEKAAANLDKVKEYIVKVSQFVNNNSGLFGNKEWMRLFRNLLPDALNGMAFETAIGSAAGLTLERATELMAKEPRT